MPQSEFEIVRAASRLFEQASNVWMERALKAEAALRDIGEFNITPGTGYSVAQAMRRIAEAARPSPSVTRPASNSEAK